MKVLLTTTVCYLLFLAGVRSQDFTYTPKNPAFGGNTFNYNWLLSSAQAQNDTEDPDAVVREETSTIDQFTESLNRQLLSRLTRDLLNSQFGEDGSLQEGTIEIGDFQLDINQGADGMVITIYDGQGGETQITIPFP